MSSSVATRRASSTALREQHPPWRAASSESSRGHCCRVTPTTSWPCPCRSAAATDESTPPHIATAILICCSPRFVSPPTRRPQLHRRGSTTRAFASNGRPQNRDRELQTRRLAAPENPYRRRPAA